VYYPDYRQTQRIGIIPDFTVVPTLSGVRSGHDEVMEFALTCSLGTGDERCRLPELHLYPNPVSGLLEYRCRDARQGTRNTIEVTDLTGTRTVFHTDRPATGTLDVTHLPAGCYLFRLFSDGTPVEGKFIKMQSQD